jgi:hypothetical protein
MRDQYLMMILDEERAVSAISKMLPEDRAERSAMMTAIRRIVEAPGGLPEENKRRLARVETLFGERKLSSPAFGRRLRQIDRDRQR